MVHTQTNAVLFPHRFVFCLSFFGVFIRVAFEVPSIRTYCWRCVWRRGGLRDVPEVSFGIEIEICIFGGGRGAFVSELSPSTCVQEQHYKTTVSRIPSPSNRPSAGFGLRRKRASQMACRSWRHHWQAMWGAASCAVNLRAMACQVPSSVCHFAPQSAAGSAERLAHFPETRNDETRALEPPALCQWLSGRAPPPRGARCGAIGPLMTLGVPRRVLKTAPEALQAHETTRSARVSLAPLSLCGRGRVLHLSLCTPFGPPQHSNDEQLTSPPEGSFREGSRTILSPCCHLCLRGV